jgi:hypothetical protein
MPALILALAIVVAAAVALFVHWRGHGHALVGEAVWRWGRWARGARGPGGTVPAGPSRDTALVMPDISGYTRFLHLSRFAEAHAQHIVTELLQAIIAAAAPTLTASKVEGDAVLLYAPLDGPHARTPEQLADALDRLIRAFYLRLDELERSNLCRCECCRHLGDLDLKAVVHRGPVTAYRLGRFTELSGMPVILTHRLLKNSAQTPRYLLVTEPAQALAPRFAGAGAATVEHAPDLGAVDCTLYSFDRADVAPPQPETYARHPLRETAGKLAANLRALWPARRD